MTTYNALQIIEEKKKVLLKENLNLSELNISISSSPQFPKHKQVKYPAHNYQIIHTHTQNPAQFSRLKLKGPSLLSKNSISAARKKNIPKSPEVKFSFHLLKMINWKNVIH